MDRSNNLQPNFNIGLLGHVSHGKSTLVQRISGIRTQKHSKEQPTGGTIQLGYANTKIWKCGICDGVASTSSGVVSEKCKKCQADMELKKHISFIDCPGHQNLMSRALSGASAMNAVILMISAKDKCPQPQTLEHLMALEIMQIKNIIVVQNKLDLVTYEDACANLEDIKQFLHGTIAQDCVIIPISAQFNKNIKYIIDCIIALPEMNIINEKEPMRMITLRSFDINKPGTEISDIKGGVIGGSIISGKCLEGDDIEISPGIITKNNDTNQLTHQVIRTNVREIYSEKNKLEQAHPGGLVALQTIIDPSITMQDRLVGQLIGHPGTLPDVQYNLYLNCKWLDVKGKSLKIGTIMLLTIGSFNVTGVLEDVKSKSYISLKLKMPVCAELDSNTFAIISLKNIKTDNRWQLMGIGRLIGHESYNSMKLNSIKHSNNQVNSQIMDYKLPLSYDELISEIVLSSHEKSKLKLPPPKLGRYGRKTAWSNFVLICNILNRPPDHVKSYMVSELGVKSADTSSINEKGELCMTGKVMEKHITNVLRKYVNEYILCLACKSFDTVLARESKKLSIICNNCKYVRST